MDQIQLAITQINPCGTSSLKEYDVTVTLNGVALRHIIFNGCQVVPSSRFNFAEFDLFTCSCGAAGCAGFQSHVVQNKTENTVKWTFPDDKSYSVEKLEYEFDRTQFEQEFENLRSTMLMLEAQKTHLVLCIRDNNSYVGIEKEGDERFEVKSSLFEDFKWYADRNEATEKFNAMLKEKFPQLHGKQFKFSYDGKEGDISFDLNYLVCRMLNEWPEKQGIKKYLKKVEAAGKSVEKLIFHKDAQDFIKVVHNANKDMSYSNEDDLSPNESMWCAFDFDLCQLANKEDFDMNKFGVVMA